MGKSPVPADLLAGASHVDAGGSIVMPGMINTHCHVSMIPFRTMGDDCPDRLRRFLFPLEEKAVTPQLVYWGALYGIAEMLLSGITTFLDMYYFEDQVAEACRDAGIRGFLGETVIGQKTCDSEAPYGGLDYGRKFIQKWKGDPLVSPLIAPHGTNTNQPEFLEKAYALACEYDTLYTLHASEMDYEMDYFAREYHQTPTEFLHALGVLSPRTLLAHCIHMTESDLDRIAAAGASVSHCIGSNTKAGKGVSPVKTMLERGIPVGLGTDGPSSGNTLSMFTQFRAVRLLPQDGKPATAASSPPEISSAWAPGQARKPLEPRTASARWSPANRRISSWWNGIPSTCSPATNPLFRPGVLRGTGQRGPSLGGRAGTGAPWTAHRPGRDGNPPPAPGTDAGFPGKIPGICFNYLMPVDNRNIRC